MARVNIEGMTCDLCNQEIPPPVPGGGEYQGGPIEIVFGAIKVRLDVCSDCQQNRKVTLKELREAGSTVHGGTAHGAEQLLYMPVVES